MIECGKIIIRTKVKEMTEAFPRERATKRKFLLDAVDSISKTLRASGARSEESATLAPEAVDALVRTGMFRLKLAEEMGGAEADPVTEMLVLEALAYHDLTSAWCTMVGATAIASLGTSGAERAEQGVQEWPHTDGGNLVLSGRACRAR